jgi:hypothetical protein
LSQGASGTVGLADLGRAGLRHPVLPYLERAVDVQRATQQVYVADAQRVQFAGSQTSVGGGEDEQGVLWAGHGLRE